MTGKQAPFSPRLTIRVVTNGYVIHAPKSQGLDNLKEAQIASNASDLAEIVRDWAVDIEKERARGSEIRG